MVEPEIFASAVVFIIFQVVEDRGTNPLERPELDQFCSHPLMPLGVVDEGLKALVDILEVKLNGVRKGLQEFKPFLIEVIGVEVIFEEAGSYGNKGQGVGVSSNKMFQSRDIYGEVLVANLIEDFRLDLLQGGIEHLPDRLFQSLIRKSFDIYLLEGFLAFSGGLPERDVSSTRCRAV